MKQMKAMISLLLCAVLFFLMTGCEHGIFARVVLEKSVFTIYEEWGYYTLVVKDGGKHIMYQIMKPEVPTYSSAQELIDWFYDYPNGTSKSSNGLLYVYIHHKNADGTIDMFDLENVYQPIQNGEEAFSELTWTGPIYSYFYLDGDANCMLYTLSILRKDYWDASCPTAENFQRNQQDATNLGDHPSRDGTLMQYTAENGTTCQDLLYTLTDGNKTIYVREIGLNEQDIPSSVEVYGTQDGGYYVVTLTGLTKIPTPEYLLSFGIERVE